MSEENKNEIISRKENNHEYNSYQVNYMMTNQMNQMFGSMRDLCIGVLNSNNYAVTADNVTVLVECISEEINRAYENSYNKNNDAKKDFDDLKNHYEFLLKEKDKTIEQQQNLINILLNQINGGDKND